VSSIIKTVRAREVLNTKRVPTIEVDIVLADGSLGRAAAPGGTSRGQSEAVDLLDGDESYFSGLGVKKAIAIVNTEIADLVRGKDASNQERIDRLLIECDGTKNKSRLGGNSIIATSLANAKAAAQSRKMPLYEHLGGGTEIPLPILYVMFGGPAFTGMAGIGDFQEYSLIPLFARSYKEGYIATLGIYKKLCQNMASKRGLTLPYYDKIAGIPVAWCDSNEEPFAILTRLIEEEGYVPNKDFAIYTDLAASQLYKGDMYHLAADGKVLSSVQMVDKLESICSKYPVLVMEDCLAESDWDGWRLLTSRLGNKVELVGDDLFATNPNRLSRGVAMGAGNAIVIKPNQIGTLTETFETIRIAKEAGYGTVISTRSGELWDPYLVHLCVGQNLAQGKIVGAYPTGESSLNEILRVEDSLGERATYRGAGVLCKFL
jgi:enolase